MARPRDTEPFVTFERAAWLALLVIAGAVPLLVTNVAFGIETYRAWTYDAVSLPKVVALMVLGGLGLGSHGIAVLLGQAKARVSRVLAAVWALAAWAAVSTVASSSIAASVFGEWQRNEGLAAFVTYAIVFTLAVQVVTSGRRIRALAAVLGTSAAAVALYGLVQFVGADPLAWPTQAFGTRLFGTFGNPDLFASFLVLPLALAVGVALSEEPPSWLFWLASADAAIIGGALVLSLVRGAWAGAAVGLAVLGFAAWRIGVRLSRTHLAVIGSGLAVIVGAILWSVVAPQEGLSVVERLRSALSFEQAGTSVGERFRTWRVAFDAGLRRPVTGYGPGGFVRAFRLVADEGWWRAAGHTLSANDAHNMVLQYWVTIGLPGAALAIVAIVASLVTSFKNAFAPGSGSSRLVYSAFWAGVVGMAVALASGVTTPMIAVWMWLAAGVLVSAHARTVDLRGTLARIALAMACASLAGFALWGASWFVADSFAASAARGPDADTAAAFVDRGLGVNPLAQEYRMLRGSRFDQSIWSALSGGASQDVVLDYSDKTVASYRSAVEAEPTDAIAQIQLLHALNQRFELAADEDVAREAGVVADDAAIAWPLMPDVRNEAARARFHLGDLKTAEADARAAVSSDPRFSYAWLTLGEILRDQGRIEEARSAMEKAVLLDPADPDAARKLESLPKEGGS